ncbi:MAG: restriction endonuclease subunit S [Pseudomonadales bacterium]
MSGWREAKLGCLGKVITGKTPSKDNPEDWGDAVLFVTPSDYKNYRKKQIQACECFLLLEPIDKSNDCCQQSVLVTCISSDMGKTVVNALPCVTNQQINALFPMNL